MAKKDRGQIVLHIDTMRTGRTYATLGLINGKVPVKFDGAEKMQLCVKERLKVIGYIN